MCEQCKFNWENVIDWGYQDVYGHDGNFEYIQTWETYECVECGFVKTFTVEGVSDHDFEEWRESHRQREQAES